jgi:hypothetical protein
MAENAVSKAILRLAADVLVSKFPDQVTYFPAYEIMLDELRDYRYYHADMIHPTDLAVNYIYERFKQAHFTDNLLVISKRWQEIYNTLQHRPHPLQFPEHREIIERLRKEIEADQSPLKGREIAWVDDQIDLFFLQIQGSGMLHFDNGEKMHVGYADQNGQGKHIGYGQYQRTPQSATYLQGNSSVCTYPVKPLAIWGSDNTGLGFEAVMIDFTQLGVGQNEVVIDCRALWWSTIGTNPVNIGFTLYKGGCMIKQGSTGSPAFGFTNPLATSTLVGASASKVITAYNNGTLALGSSDLESPSVNAGLSRGQRLAVITYNRSTNAGNIDINDTTTPVV